MNIFTRGISIMLIAVLSLMGCGGGGGGGTPAAGGGSGTGTFIAGTVQTNQAGATVSYYATIAVKNNTWLGLPITNATVSVNGTNLLLEPIMKVYVGAVTPDAAGKFNLSVAASGVTYTATDAAITSVPVVTTPNPFVASAANTVSWTAPTGAPASMKYAYTLTNTSNGAQAFTQSNLSNSVTIPANTTAAGTTYSVQLLGGWAGVAIANAVAGSSFGASVGVYPTSIVAQTGVVTLPAVPVGVAASAVSASQINLSWTAVTGATGYNVYRSATAGVTIAAANKITATPVATTSFNNTGLTAATPYFYKVTAVNGAGETVGSAEVTATTQAAAVTPPAGGTPAPLAWTSHSVTGITLLGGSLSDVAWSGTQYLSVGYANKVATSADAATWGSSAATFPGATPTSAALVFNKVAYGNGVFVAIDYYGGAYSSPDGALWTQRLPFGVAQNKNGVDFANGKFFLTDGAGGILTSADGITWSARAVPVATAGIWYNKVIWSGTQYVAVGNHILTSPDAVTWTDRGQITTPGFPVLLQNAVNLSSIVFANNLYVTAGGGVWTSPDAITWTPATPASAVWFNTLSQVAYGNGKFVATGTSGKVFTSTDGLSWTQDTSAALSGLGVTSLKFLNNQFLAVAGVQIITAP